ncbi:Fe(3+)-hydroxamate ABC transporter permease FhuB [Halovulum dunhuangense]|uniref:Fe(3+)-hydroxamate ABC transporter permease FhuB n=1 Tax=Halovulum dunhuangense TaxID=1505036 RepID=A0A849L7Z0_9RHOB|nr:Fe(3+)-hydroxamate ABC transporter permease FhuB [Halovulum dunhuangense]NNU82141.1 Fe(3+)-hydroxamate ABC transporter permease FhuB [Halovulum dunhuangense]
MRLALRIAPPATAVLAALVAGHLWVGSDLPPSRMAELLIGSPPETFEDIRFSHATLPRMALALMTGLALGLAGSLFQQVTQNLLASPLTLGAASGAWLAMVAGTLIAPTLAAEHGAWLSLLGASLAFGLVVAIAGLRGLMGLHAVLAGMAVNLLLGAVASALLLLKSPYFGHLFVWGAGDLGQTGWDRTLWLLPRLLPVLAIALLLGRGLALLRTGAAGAEARGMTLAPFLAIAVLLALALTALSVTAVGMIGFVGLLAPNLARLSGARRPVEELLASAALGGILLLGADLIAVIASNALPDMVPTGAATAVLGAPALIWLLGRRLGAQDHIRFELPPGPARLSRRTKFAVLLAAVALPSVAFLVEQNPEGWSLTLPEALILEFRWPRVIAAAAAGLGMALSGVILQRLVRNPLASPDILGMSSGATFALVGAAVLGGGSVHDFSAGLAVAGSLCVLAMLLWFGRRHGHAPAALALIGIALGALLDALVKFALAAGSEDSFAIVGWLGGSTYRVGPEAAVALALSMLAALALTFAFRRWLTLLSAGDTVAAGRGLSLPLARPASMTLAASIAAVVTAFLGPVSFVGLLAPHMAVMLGARRVETQILLAGVLGALLMTCSDWLGRMALHPMQLPAGTIAAVLGGSYFVLLLARGRILQQ